MRLLNHLLRAGVLAALVLAAFAMPLGVAADDDDDDDDGDDRYGAWIYPGTVEDVGDRPVDDIGELEREDLDDLDDIPFDFGQVDADAFYEEEEDVDLSLEQLLTEPHVVVVRATDRTDSEMLVAGAIEGDLDDRGGLLIMLEPVDDSGYAGIAYFDPDDDGDDDDETDVTVVIWEGELPAASTPTAG